MRRNGHVCHHAASVDSRAFLSAAHHAAVGLLHAQVELQDGRQENAEREDHSHDDGALAAAEEDYERRVGGGHDVVEHVGDGVVGPVVGHARHYAVGAAVHPAEQQAHEQGVWHLRGVAVGEGEKQGRHGYCHPTVAHGAEQRAQYGSAKHHLLGHGGKQAYGHVAPAVAENHGELGEHEVGQLGHLLLGPQRGNCGADGGDHAPRQHAPRAGAHVAAGHLAPAG